MSGFFDQLIERASSTRNAIRPAARSFLPAPSDHAEAPRHHTETHRDAELPHHHADAQGRGEPLREKAPPLDAETRHAETRRERNAEESAVVGASALRRETVNDVRELKVAGHPQDPERDRSDGRVLRAASASFDVESGTEMRSSEEPRRGVAVPPTDADSPGAPTPLPSMAAERQPTRAPVRAPPPSRVRQGAGSGGAVPLVPRAAPSAARPAARATRSRDATAAEPPIVHIRIGRIEVRAVTEPPAPLARPHRPAQPKLQLDEYLRQRVRGER